MGSANNRSVIRVMIADDHQMIREGLAALIGLQDDLEVVAEANDAREAVERFLRVRPDVLLLDQQMPEGGGLSALRQILSQAPTAAVLMLSTYDGEWEIHQALQLGARGYLVKHMEAERLFDAVRAAAKGKAVVPPEVAEKLAQAFRLPNLTKREFDVLALISDGKTNRDIGRALQIREGTVKTHVNSILFKL